MKLTVALPLYNAKEIVWLCLASLERQMGVDFEWELIIFEETNEKACGSAYFINHPIYDIATVRYMSHIEKLTLGEKWHHIAQQADSKSKAMVFCAADNYYDPHMLADSMNAILTDGYDWFYTTRGFFYDFNTTKILMYDAHCRKTGLQMAAKMDIARKIPDSPRKRLVDIWLYQNMRPQRPKRDDSPHWQGTLFTHGYNTISKKRGQYFQNTKFPFRKTFEFLEDIVPEVIAQQIKDMS